MRWCGLITVVMLAPGSLMAQTISQPAPAPTYPTAYPHGTVYAGEPAPYYAGEQNLTPPPAPPIQPYEPRPGEYGTSVMTDIRQMNF
jgi:hypothetical protein